MITALYTSESKGYAFIEFLDKTGAGSAFRQRHGVELEGRTLCVRLADKQPLPRVRSGSTVSGSHCPRHRFGKEDQKAPASIA